MSDIYNAVVSNAPRLENLPQDDLKDYWNSCGDAASGIVYALTALGTLSMDACENEEYSDEECRRDLRSLALALISLPRLMQALDHNREKAEFELRRREATK